MASKGGFKDKFYHSIAPVITGLGAAVVILGALFKIQHYPGASPMLIVGLGTEALLFVMFAFAPAPKEEVGMGDWAKIYPQLAEEWDDYDDDEAPSGEGLTKKLDDMMSDANINQNVVNSLGSGLNNLADNVKSMADLSNAAVATDEYAKNAKQASKSLESMSKSYASTAEAMSGMADAATDAKEYHSQVQNITKNLGSLNAVYEMELQDANNHLKAMNKFYSNLSSAMENMSEASKDTEEFKKNLGTLTANLGQLNSVYGNMLTAMKG
jgi:gliding motility-associated protein GldL